MFTLTDVLIDALWILGLAGVFATFSYMDYYRHQRRWRWRDAWQRPCLLMPLSLSLTIFSLGVGLSGATAYQPAPWWESAVWGVMTVIFAWQTFLYTQSGRRQGWDQPMEAKETHKVAEAPKEQIGAEQSQ
jgi:hypothetical protein